ncbi:3-hydroxyisobutyryl-CoA hydrolase [Cichlidogyrus casuarinus]|uniref:3-hydroxyisobutyryl-CoA hydrolase n=1 Tax=Cichlidogyrus casuarinus TaxID=1844966 RepID=A0ABD2Q776_9PLAT
MTGIHTFDTLPSSGGKITGDTARSVLMQSNLPVVALRRVWNLSDIDKDGCLDREEFVLANYLVKLKLEGSELPSTLPDHLIPPTKKESKSDTLS